MKILNNKYKFIAIVIIAAVLLGVFLPQVISADDSEPPGQSAEDGKTQIKSVIPYVEKKENGAPKNVPVESREDMILYSNSVYLKIQVYLNPGDAAKYYGSDVYIFKLRPHEEITDIANAQSSASFNVRSSEGFSYGVDLQSPDLINLSGDIYNKFVAGVKDGDIYIPITDAQYISNINCLTGNGKREIPPVSKTKKGLSIQMLGEARMLGVGYTTVNLFINEFISSGESPDPETYDYGGEKYYFNKEKIYEFDRKVKYLTNEGINVTAVLLISAKDFTPSGRTVQNGGNADGENSGEPEESGLPESLIPVSPLEYMIHPNALANIQDGGVHPYYYGINTTDERGVKYFEAFMSFIADRYFREDGKFGRIYNIILGTDIGRTMYNNCGKIDIVSYVKDYLRALRICDTAIRSRFGGSRVYVPFDNWFAAKSQNDGDFTFINKELIDLLCEYSEKEGNFIWNVAWRAYNAKLHLPECWLETEPVSDYSTQVITMKNINVLCDYINLEKKDFLPGGELRKVMLSDQGFSSVDNSKENKELQAAAFVYAYLKIRYMPDITAFIYRGHVDHTKETGLFGLWTNAPDSDNEPGEPKKIYDVFKYMDTNREAEKIEFAKALLGIEDFTEIVPRYSKDAEPAVILKEVTGETLKSKPTATNIGLFNDARLSGFIGTSNISKMSRVKYNNPDSDNFHDKNMLFAGFSSPVKGDFGGIYKIYTDEDSVLNLKDEKYVGVRLRIDTAIDMPEDQKIQLLLIMESEPQTQSAADGEANATALNAPKTISVFEGLANISPNRDEIIYFDISSWSDKTDIKKIKLLVNPYANYLNYTEYSDLSDSESSEDTDNADSFDNFDFNLYVLSIVSAHNSRMSAFQTFLTVLVIIIGVMSAGYLALYIRARIIKKKRREMRELQRKRERARAAASRSNRGIPGQNNRNLNQFSRPQRPPNNRIPPRHGGNPPGTNPHGRSRTGDHKSDNNNRKK